jgi:hypothetical protein
MPRAHPRTGIEVSLSALPAMFVASSSEGLGVACDIQELLEHDCYSTVWNQSVFAPSDTVLKRLTQALHEFEVALFIFTPDDQLHMRGHTVDVVRDNVVFEMGMFVGALGADRCLHIVSRSAQTLHLPSDLLGVLALDYPSDRPDGNRLAALGPACNKIRRVLRGLRPKPGERSAAAAGADRLAGYRNAWVTSPLREDRALLRAGVVQDPYDPAFPRAALRRVFSFLESLSDAVLGGQLPEDAVRAEFGPALLAFWPNAATLLAPPNHADEFWDPLPRFAKLFARWR